MKGRLVIFLSLLLLSTAAAAHRLNEYLEASTISLSGSKILIELRLTPGMDIAAKVLQNIDRNHDNQISATEQQAYITQVKNDLFLNLDHHHTALQPVSFLFPSVEAIKKGGGDIIIKFEANLLPGQSLHQFDLRNNHYSQIAVYLVNCLLPADTAIQVLKQDRNTDQSFYQLDFKINKAKFHNAKITQQQFAGTANNRAILKTYFVHGIWHILTGYDHLLFLCALVLGASSLWNLVKVITAFTIAHSITLTLATLGYAHLPEQIVEPLIAGSIIFVALQNIIWPKQASGFYRLIVAFFFGLFHGLGFAGGLLQLMHAMPPTLIFYAILGFSLGVEAGNQLVLLPLYSILQYLKKAGNKTAKPQQDIYIPKYASGIVALAGCYYLYACF